MGSSATMPIPNQAHHGTRGFACDAFDSDLAFVVVCLSVVVISEAPSVVVTADASSVVTDVAALSGPVVPVVLFTTIPPALVVVEVVVIYGGT